MQLVTSPKYESGEMGIVPLEEVVVCRRRLSDDHPSTTTTSLAVDIMTQGTTPTIYYDNHRYLSVSSTTTTTVTSHQPLLPIQDHNSLLTSTCRQPREAIIQDSNSIHTTTSGGREQNISICDEISICEEEEEGHIVPRHVARKRKLDDTDIQQSQTNGGEERGRVDINKENQRNVIMKKILQRLVNGKGEVPLFSLYGDLLLIPKWTNGNTGGRRRKSLAEPDLSTPIDSSTTSSESTTTQHQRPRTPAALCQVQPVESKALEEYGFTQDWFVRITDLLMKHLSECGVCVVDNFLGAQRAEQILHEVEVMHSRGIFQDGQVVSRHVQDQARGMIRGDKITWVTGSEPSCTSIGMLASIVDTIIARANTHPDARCLAQYKISWRTRAMVACYPGGGTHYVKHVDNPNGDGRCITAIYYVNKDWTEQDGGVLRIYPEGRSNDVATIEPLFDRMLFFWSDRRNPHEVLPATGTRYAITVWYLDQREREEHLARVSGLQAQT